MKKNEKKMLVQKLEWATAQLYCKRKGLSRLGIVLQESVLQHKDIGFSCIAIQSDGWAGSVLQYTGLYCREEG